MNPEVVSETAKRACRRWMVTGALLVVLMIGSLALSLLGIVATWIGWAGLFLSPVAVTVLAIGLAGPLDPSLPPPHPLQVLNNCQ